MQEDGVNNVEFDDDIPGQHSETKRDAFLRLAEKRTNAILDKIRVLSNCANPYAYEYTDDDVRRMFSAIEQELKMARAKFQDQRKRKFTLR